MNCVFLSSWRECCPDSSIAVAVYTIADIMLSFSQPRGQQGRQERPPAFEWFLPLQWTVSKSNSWGRSGHHTITGPQNPLHYAVVQAKREPSQYQYHIPGDFPAITLMGPRNPLDYTASSVNSGQCKEWTIYRLGKVWTARWKQALQATLNMLHSTDFWVCSRYSSHMQSPFPFVPRQAATTLCLSLNCWHLYKQ